MPLLGDNECQNETLDIFTYFHLSHQLVALGA